MSSKLAIAYAKRSIEERRARLAGGGGLKHRVCVSRELFGLIWRKKSKDETPGVFFHAAFDFDTPGPWSAAQKTNTNEKPNL